MKIWSPGKSSRRLFLLSPFALMALLAVLMASDPTPFHGESYLRGNELVARNWLELNMLYGRYLELRKAIGDKRGPDMERAVAEFEKRGADTVFHCSVNPGISGNLEDSPESVALKYSYGNSFSRVFDKPTAAIGITCSGEFVWFAADTPDSWSAADAYRLGDLKFTPSGDRWFLRRFGRHGGEVVADMISKIKSAGQ